MCMCVRVRAYLCIYVYTGAGRICDCVGLCICISMCWGVGGCVSVCVFTLTGLYSCQTNISSYSPVMIDNVRYKMTFSSTLLQPQFNNSSDSSTPSPGRYQTESNSTKYRCNISTVITIIFSIKVPIY